ncbi:hypothetical protein NMQ14_12980 [Methyloversatilis sp. XJ19-13]|uniref:hypothetical protein n=1 Tax=Methyloversatilis sp. XJ19-13 TaxID=2963430 RepID=UPI00211B945C|nr:hypothetical protein [Methyloversatilis sp. XJ19-13]MCQ9375166.1 hypothetical protein [Methyloversatilis sp. XJ19-13]
MAVESGFKLGIANIPGFPELPFVVMEINVTSDLITSQWSMGLPGKPSRLERDTFTSDAGTPNTDNSELMYEWLFFQMKSFLNSALGLPFAEQQFRSSQITYLAQVHQCGQFDEALRDLATHCISEELRDRLFAAGILPQTA